MNALERISTKKKEAEGDVPSKTAPSVDMPNHILDYVKKDNDNEKFLELFEAKETDIDLKTDLNVEEIVLLNKIKVMAKFLKDIGLETIYPNFIDSYLRFKVSLDRKSRIEFVDIHKKDRFEQNLRKFGDFSNLTKSKE